MAQDLTSFARRIRMYANRVGELGDEAVRAASSATLVELAYSTPIDTGEAVSNWQVGIGNAPSSAIPPYAAGEKGSTAETNRLAMLQAGQSAIDGYRSGEGMAVHIVNNAKHIGSLNDGHSTQAPRNFVELAVQNGREAVRNLRVSLK
jgi:hypothetical protein